MYRMVTVLFLISLLANGQPSERRILVGVWQADLVSASAPLQSQITLLVKMFSGSLFTFKDDGSCTVKLSGTDKRTNDSLTDCKWILKRKNNLITIKSKSGNEILMTIKVSDKSGKTFFEILEWNVVLEVIKLQT